MSSKQNEIHKQRAFDCYCKKILKNKVCNIQKEYAKRRNKEASRKNHTEGLSRRSKAIGKRTENPL